MDIAEIKKLIPFYIANTLDKNERDIVEAGLKKYPELIEEIEFWTNADEATRAYVKIHQAGHLSSEQIVGYVEGRSQYDSESFRKIENHLKECIDCREDIEIIRSTYISGGTAQDVKSSVEYMVKHMPWYRSVYIYAAAAIIIIGIILLLPKQKSERQDISQQENKYAHIELPYKHLTRSVETSDVPLLSLDSAVTHIQITVYVPHSIIDSLFYNLALLSPSQEQTNIPILCRPGRFDSMMDTVNITLPRNHFGEIPGNYSLILQEVLPVSMSKLTPESYTYTFYIAPLNR